MNECSLTTRHGLIIATSKREAADVAGRSIYNFERAWKTRSLWPLVCVKAMTLYTKKHTATDSDWHEGICPL